MSNIRKLFIRRWEISVVLAITIILAVSTITITYVNSLMEGTWNLNNTGSISLIEETASHIIWKDGSTYYRRNVKTGTTEDSSSDAATLINRAITSLTTGLIYLQGNGETWVISSSIVIDGRDVDLYSEPTLKASANFPDNSMIIIQGCTDHTYSIKIDGNRVEGNFVGVYMTYNQRVTLNLISKNMTYHDISLYDGNSDCQINLDSTDNWAADSLASTTSAMYIDSENINIHITADIRGYCQNQAIYCHGELIYVDHLYVEDAVMAIDVRAGSHVIAKDVTLLKTHIIPGRYGGQAFGAFLDQTEGTSPAILEISDSKFYKVLGIGIEIHPQGTLKYTNLTIQSQDASILNEGGKIDPTSTGLKIIPY